MKVILYSSESDCRHSLQVTDRRDMARPREQQQMAEECAQDFHGNHDGWESRWPREFTLYESEDGPALATFQIEREAVPMFTAHACG